MDNENVLAGIQSWVWEAPTPDLLKAHDIIEREIIDRLKARGGITIEGDHGGVGDTTRANPSGLMPSPVVTEAEELKP